MHLTKRQKQVLDYIAQYLAANGYAPTLEEMGRQFGLSSPATVYKHVQQLVRKGYLRKSRHQGRGIEIVDQALRRPVEAPILGNLRNGRPLEAAPRPETVELPSYFASVAPVFALRVIGDDLVASQIRANDLLVVEDRARVDDGETVVAVMDEDTATVARLYREDDGIRLRQATAGGDWIYLPERKVQVRGVVVGLLRYYPRPSTPARNTDAAK